MARSSYGRKRKGNLESLAPFPFGNPKTGGTKAPQLPSRAKPIDLAQILKTFKAEKKLKPKAGLPKLPKRY